jgi:hypothetical protein
MIPHGISRDEFIIDKEIILNLKNKYQDYILLISTIHNRINFDLLHRIVNESFALNLLVIGPLVKLDKHLQKKWDMLFEKNNFHHIDKIHGKMLKNYVAASKICINADNYDEKEKHLFRSSLKYYNYISQKKPIVSCVLHDLEYLNNKVAFMTNDENEYINYIRLILEDKLPYDDKLANEFILNSDYQNLIEKIENSL